MKIKSVSWRVAAYALLPAIIVLSAPAKPAPKAKAPPPAIAWRSSFATALQEARRLNKPIMVDLWATWCSPCRAMDERTYPQTAVVRESRKWVPVKVDIDKQPEIAARYGLKMPPMVVFLRADGTVISKLTDYADAARLVKQMQAAYAKSRRK